VRCAKGNGKGEGRVFVVCVCVWNSERLTGDGDADLLDRGVIFLEELLALCVFDIVLVRVGFTVVLFV